MKATLKAFSICACGFPSLDVPQGTEYKVTPGKPVPFIWICGGCGKVTKGVPCILVWRPGTLPGYLPQELFEINETETAQ